MGLTKAQRTEQKRIAREWLEFRKKHILSQVALAEMLGISRRAVQYTESGKSHNPNWGCVPSKETQDKFRALRLKMESEA